jgi:hypothetical protein
MAALSFDFGTPLTGMIQEVDISGKVDSGTYNIIIQLDVMQGTTVNRSFYMTKSYTAPVDFTTDPDKVYMVIAPALVSGESVQVSLNPEAKGTFTGSIPATV